jgi:hypothetical protein
VKVQFFIIVVDNDILIKKRKKMVKIIIIMTIFRFVLQFMRVNEPKPNLIFTVHMGSMSIFTDSIVETLLLKGSIFKF